MEVRMVPIDKIRPAPFQPREMFDKEEISSLAASIRESDLIEPIVVREHGNTYQIIAGERRWRAWHELKRKEIPSIIRNVDDKEAMELSLIENWRRVDLSSAEKEKMVVALWKTFGPDGEEKYKTHDDLAKKLGVTGGAIADLITSAVIRTKDNLSQNVSTRTILDTRGLESEDRQKLIKKVERGEISKTSDGIREYTRVIKESSQPVKDAMFKPKSHVTPEMAKKVMEVTGAKDQERIVKKIEKDHSPEQEVVTMVEVVKKAPESVKEAMFKPKSRVTPEIAKILVNVPEKKAAEVVKQVEQLRLKPEEVQSRVDWVKVEEKYKDEIPKEQFITMLKNYEVMQRDFERNMKTIRSSETGELMKDLQAHLYVSGALEHLRCPICGKESDNLKWGCHNLTIKEAIEKLKEKASRRK